MIGKVSKNKFSVLFIAMVLVLAFVLPSCTCGEAVPSAEEPVAEEPAAEEPAEGAMTEFVNAEFGVSLKYPAEFNVNEVEEPTFTVLWACPPGLVPSVTVDILDASKADTFAEAFTVITESAGGSEIKILAERESTLEDGTPATELEVKYRIEGYPGHGFALGTLHNDVWVVVTIVTVEALEPYDEAKFSEWAYTLELE